MRTPRLFPSIRMLALCLLPVFGAPGAVQADVAPTPHPDAAERALARGHRLMSAAAIDETVDEAVASIHESVVQGFVQGHGGAEPDPFRVAIVTEAVEASFAIERMRDIVAANLGAALDERDVERLIAHYESPFGQRLRRIERTRRPLRDREAFAAFTEGFGRGPDDAERRAILEETVVASSTDEMMAALMIDVQLIGMHGMLAFADDEREAMAWLAEASASAIGGREALVGVMRETLTSMLAYIYVDLSEGDLRRVLGEALRPDSRRMMEGLTDGMREMFVAGVAGFGPRVKAGLAHAETLEEI